MADDACQDPPVPPDQPAIPAVPSTPARQKRNQVNLDRGDGRTWSPPPTARELSAANPFVACGGPKGHGRHARRRRDLDKKNWF